MNKPSIHRNLVRKSLAASGLAIIVGGLAGPLAASAGDTVGFCPSTHIYAKYNGQVIHGTCGADLIKVGPYKNVTIYAHGGNDDVRAGWAGTGQLEVHLGTGDDSLANNGTQSVLAYGDEGNDTMEGSTTYHDTLNGGSGNDTLDAWGGGPADDVIGGTGTDKAFLDGNDVVFSVENKQF